MRRPNGARALGYRAGDAAEGDEAQRLTQQARHLEELRPPLGPAALAHHAVLLDGPAMGGEQQHHGVVGHLLDEGVGAVGDGNALLGGGGDVDVVDADAAERDEAALLQGLDHLRVELHALGVDRVRVPGGGNERLLGWRRIRRSRRRGRRAPPSRSRIHPRPS